MSREFDLTSATSYNQTASSTVWAHAELIFPFTGQDPGSKCFAYLTALFQIEHALKVDGKLGPNTWSAMRAGIREGRYPMSDERDNVPTRRGASNALVVGGKSIKAPDKFREADFGITNFVDDDEVRFEARHRTKNVTHFVIHESVTTSAADTVRVLQSRDLGVHLILAPDGHLSCHNDLVDDQPVHANQLNGTSVGIEVVNPYATKWLVEPWKEVVRARSWTWVPEDSTRQYVLPTPSQKECLELLVPWLTELLNGLPLSFPTKHLGWRQKRIDGWRDGAKLGPGIVAHQDFAAKSDGRWLLEQLIEKYDGVDE